MAKNDAADSNPIKGYRFIMVRSTSRYLFAVFLRHDRQLFDVAVKLFGLDDQLPLGAKQVWITASQ